MDTGAATVVGTPYEWKQNGIFSQPEGNNRSHDPRRQINPTVYPHQDQNEQSPAGDLKRHVSYAGSPSPFHMLSLVELFPFFG
jgi:hypothetical protein